MPESFTVFNARNRDANTWYQSETYTIPADTTDSRVELELTTLDLVNEPATTIIYFRIERLVGDEWRPMIGGDINGCGGVEPPRPCGRIGCSLRGIKGDQIRGSLRFTSEGDQRKRFGVTGRTL